MRKVIMGKFVAGAILLVLTIMFALVVTNSAGIAGGAKPVTNSGIANVRSAPWVSSQEQIEPQSTPSPLTSTGNAQSLPGASMSGEGSTLVTLVTVNVRIGPGLRFPVLGVLSAGSEAKIISLSGDQLWWQIECPLIIIAPECWITSDSLYVEFAESTSEDALTAFALSTPTAVPETDATSTAAPPLDTPTLTPTVAPTGSPVAPTGTPVAPTGTPVEPTDTPTTEAPTFTLTPTPPSITTFTPTPTNTEEPTFTLTPTQTPTFEFTATPTNTPAPAVGIDLEKTTNGQDADEPPGPLLEMGVTVVWQYVVTNISDSLLTNITVIDDQGVTVSCSQSALLPGEAMTCTASGIAILGQYRNTGTVTADLPNGALVSDTDASHYLGILPILPSAQSGCTMVANPVKLSEGQQTSLEIHAPNAVSLELHSVEGILVEFGPVPEVLQYLFAPHASLFGMNGQAVITAKTVRADGTVLTCEVVLLMATPPGKSVNVTAAHGKTGYTAEQVMSSYGLDYIPPYVVTEVFQTLQVHLAEMTLNDDRSVEVLGGRHLVSLPFQAKSDGSVDPISFTVPQGQIILLQVGDAQGKHFDTSRYIPVPYVVNAGDVNVQAYRDPGGIWHFKMEGNFDLGNSQDVIFMSEVASQHLARIVGGTVMENNVGRALARQNKFGLWQLPNSEDPDGPWASQYMAAQCGQSMFYDPNVAPTFVHVTGANQFIDLRTEGEFRRSLESFPSPPNLQDKLGVWYCDEIERTWQPPNPSR